MIKNYSVEEVSQVQNNTNIILLDVRTIQERNEFHIENSLHIPLNELELRILELEKHKEKEIICYCRSGSRSLVAASILSMKKFVSANMKGGIVEWYSKFGNK